jgi:ribonucleoside-diphosphate reductase beta chain
MKVSELHQKDLDMGKLYSSDKVDFTKEPMFFGKTKNIQRYDVQKYKFLETMYETMESFFWVPQEIDLKKDKIDFNNLSESEKHIFTSNIKFQILLDSIQGRGPAFTFSQITTLPELEATMLKINDFEIKHSKSYSHILRNVYNKPGEIFDGVLDDTFIVKRAETILKVYNKFYTMVLEWLYSGEEEPSLELKKMTILALINMNILEGIRFYNSFVCSFSFAENKKMEGNAKQIKLIARDENTHLAVSQFLINTLRKNESEGFTEIFKDLESEIIDMYRKASEEEAEWGRYLFKDGSLIGLNATLLQKYNKYITNKRLQAIGFKAIFPDSDENPLPWVDHWLNSNSMEVLPQETEITSYLVGALDTNIDEEIWEDMIKL